MALGQLMLALLEMKKMKMLGCASELSPRLVLLASLLELYYYFFHMVF